MIIGDGIMLGAGGETASIFVTGLSETDTVTASKDGKTISGKWTQKPNPESLVPTGYTQLEYIKATGSQFINTRIAPSSGISVELGMIPDTGAMSENATFGSTWSASGFFLMFYQNNIRFHSKGASVDISAFNTTSENKIVCTQSGISVNGTNYSISGTGTDSSDNIVLWSVSNEGGNASNRGRDSKTYCRIKVGDSVVREYVPCKQNSDGAIGMYDLVTNTFFGNDGTGTFTAGPEVPQTIDGFLISKIKDFGTWTVTATNGYETSIQSVYIDVATEFNVEINYEPNYTFLYYYGDECADITGGWAKNPKGTATDSNSDYVYSGSPIVTSTVNNNSDSGYIEAYIQVNSDTSASIPYRGALSLGTVNTVDLSEYTGILYKHSTTSKYGSVSLKIPISETILGNEGNYSAVTVSGIKVNVGVTLDSTNRPYFRLSAVRNNSNYSSLKLYAFCLLKPDPWDILASIANIQAVSISDILNKSDVLLSSNEAVLYMINGCTGDFMASAISSQTFMTVLESSPYKDLVYANKHWSKFLSMVQ